MTVLAATQPTESTRSRFEPRVLGDRVGSPMTKLDEIRAAVERGQHTVDAARVAEAIVDRILPGRSARDRAAPSAPQCSKPLQSRAAGGAFSQRTSGAPSAVRPIQDSPTSPAAASAAVRRSGATHTKSP